MTLVSQHDPPTLASQLTAVPTRGCSALVVGATARRRFAFLEALRLTLRERPPFWLVVHLSAPAPTAAREGFEDRLDRAFDEALHAVGAPEALHDDPSLAARVGAWLYRARAVGAEGIVLVVDELDRWLDGRSGSTARSTLLALLTQGRRAPVSVVGSVRASSAAGSAALPEDVVAAFDQVYRVGPPVATVTRDPMGLAALLAGRSFHRAGLLAAVDAWLALPPPTADHDVDDVAIVFNSPFAAPVLPLPVGIPPDGNTTERARAAVASPETQGASAFTEPTHWTEGLRAALDLAAALSRLRRATVRDVPSAERVFREDLLPVPLAAARIARAAAATGARATQLPAAAHDALTSFDRSFAPVRESVLQGADARRVEALASDLPVHATRVGARATALVWLPGLRADLWSRFVEHVVPRVPGLHPTGEEGIAWSLGPPESTAEARTITVYATALRQGLSLPALEAAEAAIPEALAAVASAFAGRTVVLLAGYGTGSPTVFETLVPWGLFTFDPFAGRSPHA